MAAYLAEAVGSLGYLVDALPPKAADVFRRAEDGLDVVRAPDVQLAEVRSQIASGDTVAGIEIRGRPTDALGRLVTDGPVDVAFVDPPVLGTYAGLTDQYTMHDGLLAACHRRYDTDGIITKDRAFAGLPAVWAQGARPTPISAALAHRRTPCHPTR